MARNWWLPTLPTCLRAGSCWKKILQIGIAGQFMLDFSSEEMKVVTSPPRNGPELVVTDVADLFARGIMLEENPSDRNRRTVHARFLVRRNEGRDQPAAEWPGTGGYRRCRLVCARDHAGRKSFDAERGDHYLLKGARNGSHARRRAYQSRHPLLQPSGLRARRKALPFGD